ncbi:hypothetical protein QQ73_02420, partial [Candidatus Endoriftia persephone str. Guaymas]|nr:hypothetical protein [Candidatus Endoriftia persephone str. Guaymas]
EVLAATRRAFDQDDRYRHATFALAVQAAGDEQAYPQVRARLEALCRWQQMQSPSLAVPDANAGKVTGVCEFDTLRPALEDKTATLKRPKSETVHISAACRVRWVEDGEQSRPREIDKEGFYQRRTELEGLQFTQDLHEMAMPDKDAGQNFGNLNNKMALVYLDGNHFGKLAREFCKTESKQEEFDLKLRKKYQDGALKTLLSEIKDDPAWKNGGRIRLETLLWGGDEIIWVAPAWKGWWLLGRFFDITLGGDGDESQKGRPWAIKIDGKERPLTHGAGLVFCHHDAPLRPLIRLVKELGDLAKKASDHSANCLAYQVLESFDHAGSDLKAMRERRWPLRDDPGGMILDGEAMLKADRAVRRIKQTDLPKRQLYRLVKEVSNDRQKAEELAEELREQTGIEDNWKGWKAVEDCFGKGLRLTAWLHLLELWDYLGLNDNGDAS